MSGIGAGKLDKRIQFLALVKEDNGLEVVESYKPVVGSVWAKVDFLSDSERFRASAVQSIASVRFTIRKREVSKTWRGFIQGISTAFSYLSGSMMTTNSLVQSLGTYFQYLSGLGTIAFAAIDFAVSALWERLKTVVSILINVADVALYVWAATLEPINKLIEAIGTWLTGALGHASSSFKDTEESARYSMDMAAAYAKDGVDTIKNAFSGLPAALGDLMMQATNAVIGALESMINGVIARINGAIAAVRGAMASVATMMPERLGGDGGKSKAMLNGPQLPSVMPVQFGEIQNQFEGAAAALLDTATTVHRDAVRAKSMTDSGNGVTSYSSPVARSTPLSG
ncbi:head-tail adaptor protein [Paracoccus sp. SSK6]|uniref:head-tail adaptor protein n=1 Tax=Paracoccus sp. SSK6 TaxID=3143131 RepID=UPI00321B6CD2